MSLPVLTVAQMRSWEAATWRTGVREIDVISKVGARLGAWLLLHTGPKERILFLTGNGHNGDDARAAAAWLGSRRSHREVQVSDPKEQGVEVSRQLGECSPMDWVVDAWFGIGLNRDFSPTWQQLVETLNRFRRERDFRVASIDVPSGLRDDVGTSAGALVEADYTLTVGAPKRGLIGLVAAGRVEVLTDVGLTRESLDATVGERSE